MKKMPAPIKKIILICFCVLVAKLYFTKKQHLMKSFIFLCLLLTTTLFSCNSSATKTTEKDPVTMTVAGPGLHLLGSYVGPFGDNKITLLITKLSGDTIEGRSVVGGNDRPYTGFIKLSDNEYNVVAKEPGDDQYDGVFNFTIDVKQPDIIKGNWKPNTEGAHLGPKEFSLQRKAFNYLIDVGQFPQASKRILKEEDIDNLAKEDLEIMRNEIFARHGYCFKKKKLRELFEDKDWYVPNSVDVKKDLTDIEIKNITLIKRYEKYAAEFGNDYGR